MLTPYYGVRRALSSMDERSTPEYSVVLLRSTQYLSVQTWASFVIWYSVFIISIDYLLVPVPGMNKGNLNQQNIKVRMV